MASVSQSDALPNEKISVSPSAGNDESAGDAVETIDDNKPPSPPNGGSTAWLQVSAAFALYWNTLGLLNGFGAFQSYYETSFLHHKSSSTISWIGSVQVLFLMSGGVVFGPLFDLGYTRSMLIAGTFLVVFGFMMTSISTEYYQILLAQGFCIGIGTGCLYIPAITLVPAYFTTRRALAMGVAAIGSSLGATLYPIIFEQLQPRIGFGWTVRVIGFITLVMCCYATAVAKPHLKPKKKFHTNSMKEFAELAGLLDTRYMIQCVAIFFSNLAFFEPLYYIQSYAETHGMQGQTLAKYLLVILNAVAIPGRIIPSLIADKIGVLDTYIGICTFTAVTVFYWISVTNRAGNIAFSVIYGFFSGSVVTLAPVVLASITDDMSILGTRLGFVAVLKGIGSLIGPPIAGAILGSSGSYLGVQLFTGLAMSLTAIFAAHLRVVITLREKRKKAMTKTESAPGNNK
ncbi:MFS general substrate transporter [Penicillium hispanicum]|uniref:MFS general substrate transporter n=1 Tax=Penicillium hispanicum TaxID=1080232 RepID=UPI00253FF3F2|nr:MFS general substrate transporter [Penicillium hispanicum]KAJ5579586.1 MFS general substrate transporter [Penicillium hispanicum]